MMKAGGKGASAGAAAVLVLLVAAAQLADAAVARRLGTGGVPPVSDVLSGPKPNPCTHDPNNPGQKCQNSPPAVSVAKATSGPNHCTYDPKDPTRKKCHYPPLTAP